ncbi:glycosyl transferase [Halostagnicola sp. A56]|uniref:glycosyltransferase family 2 protein n=1 Tax=Halostagnicola sp. A56 TaxID=1495067 RepID=UPI0004A03F46|nr:glycosyltransferase family 2 protein [Halostagnicola sp. A56]KDE56674.1 glycosyl transferase [Halostagnicola sp. A56]
MMLEIVVQAIFWGSLVAVLHTYFTYPISIWVISYIQDRNQQKRFPEYPSVALIIAAYNEEEIISKKIENSLELEYPKEKLNIIVFSDASSDRTDEIVNEYYDRGVDLVRIEGRVGKTQCQNEVAKMVDDEILVFSDANSMYEPTAIKNLIQKFSPETGCVVGELRYQESSEVEGESFYWRYESFIKRIESQIHSLVSGNGSIYAVKSSSYVPLTRDSISDFAELLEIIRNGEVVKYAPEAVAYEKTAESTSSELSRRIRIITRSWNTMIDFVDLLNPAHNNLISYQLLSHKILRWLSPIFLFVILFGNVVLVIITSSIFYQITLATQFIFYVLATIGALTDRFDIQESLITHVPYYFLYSNYGMLLGLFKFLSRDNIVTWDTESRDG